MIKINNYLALDIGEKRIGVATATDGVKIPVVRPMLAMNEDTFFEDVQQLIKLYNIECIVVGYPRNQSGEPTAQSQYIERKAEILKNAGFDIVYQDESLTSIIAKQRIAERGDLPVKDGLIDGEAARIILQDYLEQSI